MQAKTLSAGAVLVRKADSDYLYLLLRAYHYWDFPKGMVEPGESPLQAARREVQEETGVVDLDFRWGEAFKETEPYGKGKVARFYLAQTPVTKIILPVNPQLGRPEHHEYRWLPYSQARALLVPRMQKILDWAHNRLIPGEVG